MSITHKQNLAKIKTSFDNKMTFYSRYEVNVLLEEISLLQAENKQLRAEVDAYQDYISGKITLGQLEAALNRIEYQQKPVQEWREGRREE